MQLSDESTAHMKLSNIPFIMEKEDIIKCTACYNTQNSGRFCHLKCSINSVIQDDKFQGIFEGISYNIVPRKPVMIISNVRKPDSSKILQKSLAVRQFDPKTEQNLIEGIVYFKADFLERKLSNRKIYPCMIFKTQNFK